MLEGEPLNIGKQIITVIGPEGSGKSTISRRLGEQFHKPYIATGDILREMATSNHPLYGQACNVMFDKHTYLDPQMLVDILANRLAQDDTKDGFVLDGGLRTLEETEKFGTVLDKAGLDLPMSVIHLRVPSWVSIERLTKDPNARNRKDDTPEAVLKRLSHFYNNLSQRMTLIKGHENWQLFHINAMRPVEQILENIYEVLLINK